MVKRIARITDGRVSNVEVWDDGVVLGDDMVDVTGKRVGPGFTYNGRTFKAPPSPADTRTDDEKAIDAILDKAESSWTAAQQRRVTAFTAKQLRGRA